MLGRALVGDVLARRLEVTDDVSIVEQLGLPVSPAD